VQITHLSLTPTVAALINPDNVQTVKFLVTAGEGVTSKVFKDWSGRGLYQGYGPSETTNICTVKPRIQSHGLINDIGPPLKNTSAFVASSASRFIPVLRGGVGELCFGGKQVVSN
jgi:non-ribosomal peptide synthetase component F